MRALVVTDREYVAVLAALKNLRGQYPDGEPGPLTLEELDRFIEKLQQAK